MTAPAPPAPPAPPADDIEQTTELPVIFPVLVLEGIETSDGRYIEPGALTHRATPFPILAQTRNPDGGYGHDGADVIGRVDEIERVPGPEVVSRETGKPFPEGVFVWRGRGVIDGTHDAATLVRQGFLTGNSVDIVDVTTRYELPDDEEELDPLDLLFGIGGREVMTEGSIAATTLVPIPAFADAYVQLDDGQDFAVRGRPQLAAIAAAGEFPWPAWRAVEFTVAGGRVSYVRRPGTDAPARTRFAVRTGWDDVAVAANDTPWNSVAAVASLRERATRADGTLDLELYGQGFLYRDDRAVTDPADPASAYRAPVCAVDETGELVVVPAAVHAVADRLNELGLPADQAAQVQTALTDLYGRFGEAAPWERTGDTDEAAARDLGRTLLAATREFARGVRLLTLHVDEQRNAAQQQQLLERLGISGR